MSGPDVHMYMYIYIYIYIYILYTHTHIYVYIYTHTNTQIEYLVIQGNLTKTQCQVLDCVKNDRVAANVQKTCRIVVQAA